jgi:hypothetical protein
MRRKPDACKVVAERLPDGIICKSTGGDRWVIMQ